MHQLSYPLYGPCKYLSVLHQYQSLILLVNEIRLRVVYWIWNTGNFEEQFYDMNWGVLILSCLVTLFLKRKADFLVKLSSLPENNNQSYTFSAISGQFHLLPSQMHGQLRFWRFIMFTKYIDRNWHSSTTICCRAKKSM